MKEKIQSWKEKIREDVQHQFIMEPPRKLIQNCLYMFLGAFLLALGTEFFLVATTPWPSSSIPSRL
jgi:hypothetical protein